MIRNYLKIAGRNLARNRAYLLINVSGLALSMTCAFVIFSLVKYHRSFDNFHKNSDRIYRLVTELHRDDIGYNRSVPSPLGKSVRNDYSFAEKVARIVSYENQLISITDNRETKKFKEVSGIAFTETEFFEIFNYPVIEGNKNTVLSEPNTAIITENIARKYFGDKNPIGQTFRLDNRIDLKVTGILKNLPENTDRKTEIYASYATVRFFDEWHYRDDSWSGIRNAMQCFVLLRPGVLPSQVESVLPEYVKKFRKDSPNRHVYKLQPLAEVHFDARYNGAMEKRNLWILSVIGLFLIVTACVNFINLATAQALKRSKEVGIRKVLGGLKGQLFWQFISETAVITMIGVLVAILLTYISLPIASGLFKTQLSFNPFSDWQLAVFIPALTITVVFFAGLYPGMIMAGFRPVVALKGKLSQQNIGGFNARRSLIITQFAISQILIIGMIVVIFQMQYAKQADLGFQKEAVVMIPVGSDSTGTQMNTIKNRFAQIPGIEKVSLCFAAPASEDNWGNFVKFDTRAEPENFRTSIKSADDQYVSTFGLQLVAGRNILPSDTVREFIVNETLVRKLNLKTPDEILGKNLIANGGSMIAPVVGVVKDFHDRSMHEDINPVCITTYKIDYQNFAVKINTEQINTALAALEKVWSQSYPDQIYEYHFLDEAIAKFYETEETMLKLIQAFAVISIFISCLGLFGLVKFMAAQKTKEIGIRKLLGSSISGILWIFGKEFSRLILIAFFIAAPVAWFAMNKWLENFKYQIDIGASVFFLTIAGTFIIAFITVAFEAIRAALANPVKSLRAE